MPAPKKEKKPSCGGCAHFEREIKDKAGGFCHRYPPVDHKFPLVTDEMVCGEFKSK